MEAGLHNDSISVPLRVNYLDINLIIPHFLLKFPVSLVNNPVDACNSHHTSANRFFSVLVPQTTGNDS